MKIVYFLILMLCLFSPMMVQGRKRHSAPNTCNLYGGVCTKQKARGCMTLSIKCKSGYKYCCVYPRKLTNTRSSV